MRLSNVLKSVLIEWISSVFLPVISKIPSTLLDSVSTFSIKANSSFASALKSERRPSKITVNSLSLFRLDSLFFNLGSFVFSKFTTMDVNCQCEKSQ